MQIPTIGGPKGIFEILIPGVFLLLNFAGALCMEPVVGERMRPCIASCSSNPFLAFLVVICFGYLIGVILHFIWVDALDRMLVQWHVLFKTDI